MNIKFVKVFLRGCFLKKKLDLWNSPIYVRKQKLTGKCHLCDVIPIILKWVIWSNFDWDVLGFLRKTHFILSCPRHRQQLDCRDDEGIEQFINDIKVGRSRHLCDPIGLNEIYRLMALDQRKWPKMYGCIFPYSHVNLSQAFISVYFKIKIKKPDISITMDALHWRLNRTLLRIRKKYWLQEWIWQVTK